MLTISQYRTKAITAYERGQICSALEVLRQGLHRHPEAGCLWELRGLISHAQGRTQRAQSWLETAATLVPLEVCGQFALAACYLQTGYLQSALAIYRHLFRARHVPSCRLPELAGGFAQLGALHEALAVWRSMAERNGDCDEAFFMMAYCMGQLAYPVEHIVPLLERAVELAPDAIRYRVALAALLEEQGELEKAYRSIAFLPVEALRTVNCENCLRRLLRVCHAMLDGHRRAVLLERLSQLSSAES